MEENELKLDASPEDNEPAVSDEGAEKEPVNIAAEVFGWVDTLLYAFLAVITVFTFFTRMSTVQGSSMNPTLEDGEKLMIVNPIVPPARNDIIVAWEDDMPDEMTGTYGKPIVKRVIGVAGDTIDIDGVSGTVIRNGERLPIEVKDGELYEDGHRISSYTTDLEDFDGEITVPDGYLFVMGDNRCNSTDSRSDLVGLVDVRNVVGKAYMKVYPYDRIGGIG